MNALEDQIKTSRKVIIEMLTDREYNTTNIDPHIPDMLFATLFSQFEIINLFSTFFHFKSSQLIFLFIQMYS